MKAIRIGAALAALALLLTLTACNGGDGDTTAVTTTTKATVAATTNPTATAVTTTAAEEPAVTAEAPAQPASLTYHSGRFGFSLTLPASWEGAYATREVERGVQFFELQNYQANAHGKLFSIYFVPDSDYRDEMYPDYFEIVRLEDTHILWLNVTDMQYDA